MRIINEIIVHCSATKAGQEFHAEDIKRWHVERGFKTIGYHFVVTLDGTVERGRAVGTAGAHCKRGGHNAHSIGICYVGGLDANGKPADTRTPAQKAALNNLIGKLVAQYHADVWGHRDFDNSKACPCFDAHKEYHNIYITKVIPGAKIVNK